MSEAFKPIRFQETPQVLVVLATLLRDENPGIKEKIFQIDSFKKHIFQDDQNSSNAVARLKEAAIYQEIKGDLERVQKLFEQNKFDAGKQLFEETFTKPLPITLADRPRIRSEIYQATQTAANSKQPAKEIFNDPEVDLNIKKQGLQKGITSLTTHWSAEVLQSVPDDVFVSNNLDQSPALSKALEDANQKIQQLTKEKSDLATEIASLKRAPSAPEKSGWGMWILKGFGMFLSLIGLLDLITYISRGTQGDKI